MTTDHRRLVFNRFRVGRWAMACVVRLGARVRLTTDEHGWGGKGKAVELRVLSSPARYVSGGDARIEVRVPSGLQNKVELYLNGRRLQADLKPVGKDRVQARDHRARAGREPAGGADQGALGARRRSS